MIFQLTRGESEPENCGFRIPNWRTMSLPSLVRRFIHYTVWQWISVVPCLVRDDFRRFRPEEKLMSSDSSSLRGQIGTH